MYKYTKSKVIHKSCPQCGIVMHRGVEKILKNAVKIIDIYKKEWYNKNAMDMQKIIEKYKKEIFEQKREIFEKFRAILLEYNEKYNLTSILDEEGIYYKHFLDSALGAECIEKNARVAEVGSGAGFPSIVLKILRPDISFDLFESIAKKCEFLKAVVDKLELSNVHIYNLRAEESGKDKNFREKYDIVTARAVARMNTLCEYCMPLVKVGGKFIAYKGGNTEEIDEAKTAIKTLGGRINEVISYALPNDFGERTLAIVEKNKPTPPRYPRGQGKERKNPL